MERYPQENQLSSDEEMVDSTANDYDSAMEDESTDEDLGDDDNDDDDSIEASINNKNEDLFHQRFSQEPLNESMCSANPSTITKVSVDASVELHISSATKDKSLTDLLLKEKDPKKVSKYWQKCAQSSMEGNRKVLRNQWKRFNKSFTDRQCPIYMALSRYADLFVTTESLKVRSMTEEWWLGHLYKGFFLTCFVFV